MIRSTVFTSNRSQAVRLPRGGGPYPRTCIRSRCQSRPQPCDQPTGERVGRSVRERPPSVRGLHERAQAAGDRGAREVLMLQYILDTNICIYVIKELSGRVARTVRSSGRQLCLLNHAGRITLRRREISAPPAKSSGDRAIHGTPGGAGIRVQGCGALWASPRRVERAGTPGGRHDMQIGGHARSEGLIVVTKNMREFARMSGVPGGELDLTPSVGSSYHAGAPFICWPLSSRRSNLNSEFIF